MVIDFNVVQPTLLSVVLYGIVATGNHRCEIISVIYRRKAHGTRNSETITFFVLRQMTRRYGSQ